jgi:DNA gyrase subunit A
VNLIKFEEGEKIAECVAVRDFSLPQHYLMMATKKGLVKKSPLSMFSRPRAGGIIAIKLREDDELIDVVVTQTGDDVLAATANGMAIRFDQADARPMGRNTSGVKGITLRKGDEVVGMVVAKPDETLLTVCENGYGKRTNFGARSTIDEGEAEDDVSSAQRYRTQRRGGKGIRDIKTTARNGKVMGIVPVVDDDEILLMTSRGKIQRIACRDLRPMGRNTQGVSIMRMDEGDSLAAVVRVPRDENGDDDQTAGPPPQGISASRPLSPAPAPAPEELLDEDLSDDLDGDVPDDDTAKPTEE